jgi:hypothetical protein
MKADITSCYPCFDNKAKNVNVRKQIWCKFLLNAGINADMTCDHPCFDNSAKKFEIELKLILYTSDILCHILT